ncbi:MAG: LysR family transcriptional regulator [Conexibacter sp.]|nr:LysR family transcriptional regulator [Conexibacter sp.]
MDLRQLEYFAAVARHRHFRRAAEDLYVTQSAVSQQVRRLEAELGVALLRRRAGAHPPVEVTPAGEELLARAEAILADVAQARAAMDQHAGTLRGGVRTAATTGDALHLARGLARFGAEHPGVRVALRQGAPGEVLELVVKGSVDVAVAALPAAEAATLGDELDAVGLGEEPLVLLVPPDDPLAGTTGVKLWDVRDRSFVLTEPGTALRESVLAACAEQGFGPVPLFEVGEPTAVRFLVGSGLGVSLVPASWLSMPGPDVGVATPAASAGRHALWLLSRRGGLTPVARLLHAHLRTALSAGRAD